MKNYKVIAGLLSLLVLTSMAKAAATPYLSPKEASQYPIFARFVEHHALPEDYRALFAHFAQTENPAVALAAARKKVFLPSREIATEALLSGGRIQPTPAIDQSFCELYPYLARFIEEHRLPASIQKKIEDKLKDDQSYLAPTNRPHKLEDLPLYFKNSEIERVQFADRLKFWIKKDQLNHLSVPEKYVALINGQLCVFAHEVKGAAFFRQGPREDTETLKEHVSPEVLRQLITLAEHSGFNDWGGREDSNWLYTLDETGTLQLHCIDTEPIGFGGFSPLSLKRAFAHDPALLEDVEKKSSLIASTQFPRLLRKIWDRLSFDTGDEGCVIKRSTPELEAQFTLVNKDWSAHTANWYKELRLRQAQGEKS